MSADEKEMLRSENPELLNSDRLSGFQTCNLTTINGAAAVEEEDFLTACIHAAVIGTLQAAYTDLKYLSAVSRIINSRDSLLGVSICGIMDNPSLLLRPEVLEAGAHLVQAVNRVIAALIGIRPAARMTAVKPEGTASLLLGAGSGIHPHHARRYFRRVQFNRKETVPSFFKSINPQMSEVSVYRPDSDDVLTFPVEAPAGAMLRSDLTAVQFLKAVRLVQQHWVGAGANAEGRNPELRHNVSNTCTVSPEEWNEVREYIWAHRADFTGVSLLQQKGDKVYAQAPREEVSSDEDIVRWNRLTPRTVDFTLLTEATDNTAHKAEAACAGGACEVL
jgi:ribonucleoside-diphosphate reductase alpha chain